MSAPYAVIGGGLMGTGIALTFAAAGRRVAVFEPASATRASILDRAAEELQAIGAPTSPLENIHVAETLADAVEAACFITEAAPEKLELKQSIFEDLERLAPEDAVLASNTSVIPISLIASRVSSAHRVVGTHWWNPAHLIPLVEVVPAERTSAGTVDETVDLLKAIGKAPARVLKDQPGFVANRLQHALWREAIAMVAEGVCDAETLDLCVKMSFGRRLAVLGPLENADLVGLDLTLDIHNVVIPQLDRHAGPHELLERKIAAGDLGFKTGKGFRSWTADEQRELRSKLRTHLVAAAVSAGS